MRSAGLENIGQCPVGSSTNRQFGPASPRNKVLSLAIISCTCDSGKLHRIPSFGSTSRAGFTNCTG